MSQFCLIPFNFSNPYRCCLLGFSALPVHAQIFDHIEVSTQCDFIFRRDITFQFVKEGLALEGYVGCVFVSYLKCSIFCCLEDLEHLKMQSLIYSYQKILKVLYTTPRIKPRSQQYRINMLPRSYANTVVVTKQKIYTQMFRNYLFQRKCSYLATVQTRNFLPS